MIRSLERQGMSRSGIARKMRISSSTICRWYLGSARPTYQLGAELLWLAGFDPPDVSKTATTDQPGVPKVR